VTDEALALAFRSGLPFVGLRDHEPDPDLDRIVPPDAARTARALPLAAEDHHIRLAVADPEADLSALNPYLTGRQIDLALAPREELDAILGPPPVAAEPEQAADQAAGEDDEADHEPVPAAPGYDEPEPLGADHAAPTEADEPEPLAAAAAAPAGDVEPEALEAAADDEPQPLAAAGAAPAGDEPEPLTAAPSGHESEAAGEPDPGPLWVAGTSQIAHEAELAAVGGEPGPDPGGEAAVEPSGDGGTAGVVAAEPGPPIDDHPELAGELPSWLEPPRRGRRVLLTVLIVIVVLAIAAAVLIAFVNA
jgi:type II secretion system (T2SS) protein E